MLAMKVAFIADTHLANHKKWGTPTYGSVAPVNTRALDILSVISAARRRADEEGCSHLFVLGDVFDTTCPSPQLIAECQRAFATTGDLQVHLMIGNHDQQSPAKGDHALVALDGLRNCHVYEKADTVYLDGEGAVMLLPYHPGRADEYLVEEVRDIARAPKGKPTALGLHLGLRDDDTPAWLQNAHDSFPVNRLHELGALDLVVAGNWHERKQFSPAIWQLGALVPTGFDNPGFDRYGSLMIWDGKKARVIELDGPRFIRCTGLDGARKAMQEIERRATGWTTYVSVRCRLDEREDAQELFELYDHRYYEVLTDKAAAEDAARSAATAAAYASTDSIQSAVRAYVERMALPADIVREEVLGRALNYVAGAAQ